MKKFTFLIGAAFLAAASAASFGDIILVATPLTGDQLTALSGDATLTSNGWVGYDLTLQASGSSTGISAIDFHNVVAVAGMPQSNIGISGDIHQEWSIPKNDGSNSALATSTPDQNSEGLDGYDSFWYNPVFQSDPNPPAENNNLQSGAAGNPPYTASPISDIAATNKNLGYAYGVGSLMTLAGAYNLPFASTEDLAFIIVPSSVPTVINGVAVDQSQADFAIEMVLNPTTVPEPASLGLLGLGALGLLRRRRR